MINNCLITSEELSETLNKSDWIILDCRFDLQRADWGFQDYQVGHIPGAMYADMNRDYSKHATKETGRHPLPDTVVFSKTISQWGITPQKSVVVYDTVNGAFAARLWWMLRNIGYANVYLLDGGYTKWVRSDLPVEKGVNTGEESPFLQVDFNDHQIYSTNQILQIVNSNSSEIKILDARAPGRYRGDFEPIDPVAGHIPGAINRFHEENLTEQGLFKSPAQLYEEYQALLKGTSPENTIIYCGSGVTSCHNIFAMEIAGLPKAKLYAGSWSEWVRDQSRPIRIGKKP